MSKYINEYKLLHEENVNYGTSGIRYLKEVCLIIDYLQPKTVIDYGCGKAILIKTLSSIYPDIEFYGYDPAIPGRDVLPLKQADLLINTDVLEHIPEEDLQNILNEIAKISNNCYFALHHALAYNTLPNGENAHCTVKPPIWYYNLLCKFFKTPYPLKGNNIECTSIITFSPTVDFLRQYELLNSQNIQITTQKINSKIIPYKLGRLISCFIPKKKNRHHFMDKWVKIK